MGRVVIVPQGVRDGDLVLGQLKRQQPGPAYLMDELADLPAAQALEIARSTMTVCRELAAQAEDQLALAQARVNQEARRALSDRESRRRRKGQEH